MQSFRNRVLGCVLAAALAVAPASLAGDREAGPHLRPDRPIIARIISYLAHALGGISIPPG
jgi:hypothetical protein